MPKLTVIISQSQSKHPARRELEENLAAALLMESDIDVSVISHLYDITPDHTAMLFLSSLTGDVVLLSWLYPRAAHWMLDRNGIKGKIGETELKEEDDDEDEFDDETGDEESEAIGAFDVPDRYIYSLDLRNFDRHEVYLDEIRRISEECKERQKSTPAPAVQQTFVAADSLLNPTPQVETTPVQEFLDPTKRRWYPVIDFGRCTNCMECIDFCLFGVYGVDNIDRILVESPDNCRKGCPACSRVCPEHAIIFPEYKTPAIAGANVGGLAGLKIDLSKLFGGGDSIDIAASERDVELVKSGRDSVGLSVGIPKRQSDISEEPKDDLDNLIDALDDLDI